MAVIDRRITSALIALALALVVGAGAPLHMLVAHADSSPSGHPCAVCSKLCHDSAEVDDPAEIAIPDPSSDLPVAPAIDRTTDERSTPRVSRAPPSLLA